MCKHKVKVEIHYDVVVTYCEDCGAILDAKERVHELQPIYPLMPTYPISPDLTPGLPGYPWYWTTTVDSAGDDNECVVSNQDLFILPIVLT